MKIALLTTLLLSLIITTSTAQTTDEDTSIMDQILNDPSFRREQDVTSYLDNYYKQPGYEILDDFSGSMSWNLQLFSGNSQSLKADLARFKGCPDEAVNRVPAKASVCLGLRYLQDIPGQNVLAMIPERPLKVPPARSIGLWVQSGGSGFRLSLQMTDAAGTPIHVESPSSDLDWIGWRYIEFPLESNLSKGGLLTAIIITPDPMEISASPKYLYFFILSAGQGRLP